MQTVIVDVRSPKEFNEGSYPGALNLPVESFEVAQYERFKNEQISLVCFSGGRAQRAKQKLQAEGFDYVTILKNQMVHIQEGDQKAEEIWTIDRQFRLAVGLLLGFGLVNQYFFQSVYGITVLLIVFAGLIYSALTDNCYLKEFLAKMPWNRRVKSQM